MNVVLTVICFTAGLVGVGFTAHFFVESTRFIGKDVVGMLGALTFGYLTGVGTLALFFMGTMVAMGGM